MKHVAQAADVSVMTVSLALRHDPSIPAATRERVLAAAEKLGYRRNPLVAALMAGLRGWHPRGREAHVIAYVESYPLTATPQQTGSLRRFSDGAAACAVRHGYRLQIFRMGESGLSEARLRQVLDARGIRGVVFAPFPQTGSALAQPWENHALATLGFSLAQPRLHRAVNHQNHSIRLALAELVALGYRRIGLVIGREHDLRVNHLFSAAVTWHGMNEAGAFVPPLVCTEALEHEIGAWFARERPDAIVATEEPAARACVQALRLKVPGPVGVACTSAGILGARGNRMFSGVDELPDQIGAAAVDLLASLIERRVVGLPVAAASTLLAGRWTAGPSTPRRV
jgi:LacI family transcriptional regulator